MRYIVKDGEDLYDIAERFLGDRKDYFKLMIHNGLIVNNIAPGQGLIIPQVSISEDVFNQAFDLNGYPRIKDKYQPFLNACKYAKITRNSEAAMFLTHLLVESNGFTSTIDDKDLNESSNNNNYNRYIGRGYLRLRNEESYRAASIGLGYDYVNNPDLVAQEEHAWKVASWCWINQMQKYISKGFNDTIRFGIKAKVVYNDKRHQTYYNVCMLFNENPKI